MTDGPARPALVSVVAEHPIVSHATQHTSAALEHEPVVDHAGQVGVAPAHADADRYRDGPRLRHHHRVGRVQDRPGRTGLGQHGEGVDLRRPALEEVLRRRQRDESQVDAGQLVAQAILHRGQVAQKRDGHRRAPGQTGGGGKLVAQLVAHHQPQRAVQVGQRIGHLLQQFGQVGQTHRHVDPALGQQPAHLAEIRRNEGHPRRTQVLRQPLRQLDVHAHEISARIDEGERHPVADEGHPQHAARADALQRGNRHVFGRRRLLQQRDRQRGAGQVGVHQCLVLAVDGVDGVRKAQLQARHGDRRGEQRDQHGRRNAAQLDAQATRHGAGRQECERQQAHHRDHRIEFAGDDARGNIEVEEVVRHAQQVHQERQRHLGLGEVAGDARAEQHEVGVGAHGVTRQPGGEGHEQQRQQLAGVGHDERDRHHHVDGRARVARVHRLIGQCGLDVLHQHRQHDEGTVGDERGEQRFPAKSHHLAPAEGRECGHRQWNDHEGQQQRGATEDDEIGLQAAQRLERHRAGHRSRDREHAIGREAQHELRDSHHRALERLQARQQRRLAGHADERHAQRRAEQHQPRHDGVGHRVEGVGRYVQLAQRKGLRRFDQRVAVERSIDQHRIGQRHHRDHGTSQHQQQAQQRGSPQAQPPRRVRVQLAQPADQREHQVRQHRHLHAADIQVGQRLQQRCVFAEEQPHRHAGEQAEQDAQRRALDFPQCGLRWPGRRCRSHSAALASIALRRRNSSPVSTDAASQASTSSTLIAANCDTLSAKTVVPT